MEKFVVDTSVLVADPGVLFLPNSEIIIPSAAIKELDGHKKRADEVGRNARHVSRFLDSLRERGSLLNGVEVENSSTIRVDASDTLIEGNDKLIVECAKNTEGAILLTKDINVRIAADAMGVKAEDYTGTSDAPDELYKGWREIEISPERIDKFYHDSKLSVKYKLQPNEFVIMKDDCGMNKSAIARFDANTSCLVKLVNPNEILFGSVKALNVEQKFAVDLLMNDNVPLVSFIGKAGTGKTLLALAAGLQQVIDDNKYRKLIVCKPIIPVGGKDLGAMPGDFEEKMAPWATGILDNLDFLMHCDDCEKDGVKMQNLDELLLNKVQILPLSYLRGRTLRDTWILIDEAQNTTPKEIKTVISRAGEGSKVILTGDIQQIDHVYLDQMNNGLTHVVNRFKGQKEFGHISMVHTERSRLADLASELL
jgi:PhoH-like ATPase